MLPPDNLPQTGLMIAMFVARFLTETNDRVKLYRFRFTLGDIP